MKPFKELRAGDCFRFSGSSLLCQKGYGESAWCISLNAKIEMNPDDPCRLVKLSTESESWKACARLGSEEAPMVVVSFSPKNAARWMITTLVLVFFSCVAALW